MKAKDITESGLYVVTGPAEQISTLPTQNVLFLYPNGDMVVEGEDFKEYADWENHEVVLVASAKDYPSLIENNEDLQTFAKEIVTAADRFQECLKFLLEHVDVSPAGQQLITRVLNGGRVGER